ncbi:MAG TPA: aldolase/citrate lyase family protein [Jatrophihabitans sp.]|nr:aldolase/citrate lyase family protein [Jatrophihabitans sp.]
MRSNSLTAWLAAGHAAVGGWLSMDSPYLAEQLSYAGFDCVTVDLQHGMFGLDRAITLLQAVSAGPAVPLARCPSHDPATIGKLLDAGAYGIICPAVDTAAQAAAFVAACRYPPLGIRSFGPSRGLLYGGPDYFEHADATVLALAMIESQPALDNLDAILATPGLDGIFVGPNDLALALGERPGQREPGERTAAALHRIVDAAQRAGRIAGIFCADGQIAHQQVDRGFNLVVPGNDAGMVRQIARERVAAARGLDASQRPAAGGSGY